MCLLNSKNMQVNYPEPRRNHAVKDVNSIEIHNLFLLCIPFACISVGFAAIAVAERHHSEATAFRLI